MEPPVQAGGDVVSRAWQAMKGLRPRASQVLKMLVRVSLVFVPWSVLVPPLIFRLITTGRMARSAALLSEGPELPLNGSDRQPLHLPHGRYHRHGLGAEPMVADHLSDKIHWRHIPLATLGALSLQIDVIDHPRRHDGDVRQLAGAPHRTAQEGAATPGAPGLGRPLTL
jgi:hypothetical protein